MFPSTPLSRMRFASKLCKHGAWAIAVLGLAVIVLFILNNLPNTNNPGLPGPDGSDFNALLNTLLPALLITIPTLFFFLMLYAVGAVLDHLSTEKTPTVIDDERVEITSLSERR